MPKRSEKSLFSIGNVSILGVAVEFLKTEEQDSPVATLIERLESVPLKDLKKMESVIVFGKLDKLITSLNDIPAIVFEKERIRIGVTNVGVNISIGRNKLSLDDDTKEKKISKKELVSASSFLNQLLLEFGGLSRAFNIKVTTNVTYNIPKRTPHLNHILDIKRLESSSKLGMVTTLDGVTLKFKSSEEPDSFESEVIIRKIDMAKTDSDERLSFTIKRIEESTLRSFNLEQLLSSNSEICRRVAAILGV